MVPGTVLFFKLMRMPKTGSIAAFGEASIYVVKLNSAFPKGKVRAQYKVLLF